MVTLPKVPSDFLQRVKGNQRERLITTVIRGSLQRSRQVKDRTSWDCSAVVGQTGSDFQCCPLGLPPVLSLGSLQAALRWAARPLGPEGNKNPQSQC